MSLPKFTPGPWNFCPATMYRGDLGHAYDICTGGIPRWDETDFDREEGALGLWDFPEGWVRLGTTSDMGPEARANAALISAAPDLYAALDEMLAEIDAGNLGRLTRIEGMRGDAETAGTQLARIALAKARGEVRP